MLDLVLPDMSGDAVLEQLRCRSRAMKLPVGAVALATRIQSLALPAVQRMRRQAIRRPSRSLMPASPVTA